MANLTNIYFVGSVKRVYFIEAELHPTFFTLLGMLEFYLVQLQFHAMASDLHHHTEFHQLVWSFQIFCGQALLEVLKKKFDLFSICLCSCQNTVVQKCGD
jgi:hypothetical protein